MKQARPGARHDESVLFSLEALKNAEANADSPPVADGSGLIDIRKLAASMMAASGSGSPVDSIAHLGTGGVFAPTPSVETAPAPEVWVPRALRPARGRSALVLGVCVALAIALTTTARLELAQHPSTPSLPAPLAQATPIATSSPAPTPRAPEAPPPPEPAPPVVTVAPPVPPVVRKPQAPLPVSPRPFDVAAATRALAAVNLRGCTLTGGPPFEGHARVTLDPSGAVSNAVVDSPELAGTAAERCVVAAYRRVRVPTFSGPAVTVGKRFVVMGG